MNAIYMKCFVKINKKRKKRFPSTSEYRGEILSINTGGNPVFKI